MARNMLSPDGWERVGSEHFSLGSPPYPSLFPSFSLTLFVSLSVSPSDSVSSFHLYCSLSLSACPSVCLFLYNFLSLHATTLSLSLPVCLSFFITLSLAIPPQSLSLFVWLPFSIAVSRSNRNLPLFPIPLPPRVALLSQKTLLTLSVPPGPG